MKKNILLIFMFALFCVVSQALAQRRLSEWVASLPSESSYPSGASHPSSTPSANHKRIAFIFSQTHIYDENKQQFVLDKNIQYRVGNFIQVRSALERFGKFDSIGFLVGPELNKENVRKVFQFLAQETNPGDEIFIYWESHGATDEQGALPLHSSEEGDGHNEYLILGRHTVDEVITDDEFGDMLLCLKGRRVMLLMEACHSGGMLSYEAQSRNISRTSLLSEVNDPETIGEFLESLCGDFDYRSITPLLSTIIEPSRSSSNFTMSFNLTNKNKKNLKKSTKKSKFFKKAFNRFVTKDIGANHTDVSVILSSGETEASYCALYNNRGEKVVYDLNDNRWLTVTSDRDSTLPVGAPVFALIVALSDTTGKYSSQDHTDFRDVWNIAKDLIQVNCDRINGNYSNSGPHVTQIPQYLNNTGPIDVRPAR